MKILSLHQIFYDTNIHGYSTREIYFNPEDISCIQETYIDHYGEATNIWLKGHDDSFAVKGKVGDIIAKYNDAIKG